MNIRTNKVSLGFSKSRQPDGIKRKKSFMLNFGAASGKDSDFGRKGFQTAFQTGEGEGVAWQRQKKEKRKGMSD